LLGAHGRDARGYTLSILIKLDSNENPFGPSPLAVEAMQAALAACGSYPDDDASALRIRLAELHDVNTEQILVTGGLTEFLGMLARAFLANGSNAVTSERSFIVYRIATQTANARLIEVPMLRDSFDLGGIAAAVNQDSRIIFLANPNNPTGTVVTADEVDQLLDKIPKHVVVVLDEAYYEFAADFATKRGVSYSRSHDYVRAGRNVVVLRTFSKVHGLAGVRVGYGIAPAKLMEQISRQRALYCVSNLAQAGAQAALEDKAHIRRAVENNTDQSERLIHALSGLGCVPPVPWANFLYCELGRDAMKFAEQFRHLGIAVRSLEQWGAPQAIRITIGTPEQNDALLKALEKVKDFSR
jgi:histidinol-phosphate aminotransferase